MGYHCYPDNAVGADRAFTLVCDDCRASVPFANSHERADLFKKHGADFGAKSDRQYEAMADAFLLGPKSSTALDYTRSQGDVVRFDPVTDEFGVLSATGEVRTYFKPVPGVTHARSTNLAYFEVSCLRF